MSREMQSIKVKFLRGAVLAVALGGFLAAPAWAQQAEGAATTAPPPAPKVKVERAAGGQKVFRITEGIVVEGRLQKPNAFYVLQRSSIDYDWETLNQGFLPRILQATGQSPF
jgi:hypothetical protein